MNRIIVLLLLALLSITADAQNKGIVVGEAERNSCFAYATAESPVNPDVKILLVSSYIHRQKYKHTDASDKLSNASNNYYINIINCFNKKLEKIVLNERIFVSGTAKDIVFDSQIAESQYSGSRAGGFCPISVDDDLAMQLPPSTRAFSVDCRQRLIDEKREEGYHVFQVKFDEFYENRDSYGQLWTEQDHLLAMDQVEKLSPLEVEVYRPTLIKGLPNYQSRATNRSKTPSLTVSREPSSGSSSRSSESGSSSSSGSSNEATVYNNIFMAAEAKRQSEERAVTDFVAGVADLFAPSPEKLAREKKESEIRMAQIGENYRLTKEGSLQKFEEKYFAKLITKARQGDKEAKMKLVLTHDALAISYKSDEIRKWYLEALSNNNTDALLYAADEEILKTSRNNSSKEYDERANSYIKLDSTYQNAIPLLIKAADLGSVDAMMHLAYWYDQASYYKSVNRNGAVTSIYSPNGNNPNSAMKWLKKAADAGSPNAMYYLGMIYKYDRTSGKENKFNKMYQISYNVKKDEKIAFDYFSKAVQPDYSTTDFAKYRAYGGGTGNLNSWPDSRSSHFEKETYLELALMYEKGKVVPKDKAKAQEYRELYSKYISTNQF